ncbi:hypothetical protein BDP27DRAFT_1266151 [Rhodocollybia butyracea]|uniref:C2H2-type domain-containing protein n=1 Tax=Rhodocollybia butyracea TaxID=206335 RepID=A0A9P5PSI4_9AGAR|nr:hypothetical protein BDP27DRAFT_1266151 [Rhodocollybia butyracea]
MSDFTAYTAEHLDLIASQGKRQHAHDFSYLNTADDVLAPTSDEFDSELDAIIGDIDFDLLAVQTTTDPFIHFRGVDQVNGPPSAFTFSSSESSYDSHSVHSESSYGYSPHDTSSNHSFPLDLDLKFQRFGVDQGVDNAARPQALDIGSFQLDLMSRSPQPPAKQYQHRSSFSDYGPINGRQLPHDYFNQLMDYGSVIGGTVSLDQINSPSVPLVPFSAEMHKANLRRKHKCTICPRAFDRAFNLKAHMDTHNPNRKKPFVCHHDNCRRAFSRKHDLGRHLTSIHHDEAKTSSVGVAKGARTWCDSCGKGFVGNRSTCECAKSESADEVK